MKDHNLFKPQTLEEGKHAVVGNCNGFTMAERWEKETPAFTEAILRYVKREGEILDYGCGVGRLAKEILTQDASVFVTGTDASAAMMAKAEEYVQNERFHTQAPQALDQRFDLIYLVYVLQHVPAIEIREVLSRIHTLLKDDGVFIYCSSEYRMAIRFDGGGFFDDRFLGVDLKAEILRFFEIKNTLFQDPDYVKNDVLRKMITGNEGELAHPAYILTKRKIEGPLFNATPAVDEERSAVVNAINGGGIRISEESEEQKIDFERKAWDKTNPKNILLINRLAPGDILVMTNAIRDLHKAHPGMYLTDIRTPCDALFANNPHITKFLYDETEYSRINSDFSAKPRWKKHPRYNTAFMGNIMVLDMHYPLIHKSGTRGSHFSEGHRDFLEQALGINIPQTDLRPEIYLSQDEVNWPSPALVKAGVEGPYWVINAGSKGDFTLKQYPFYQEVIDKLKDRITFIQIGQKEHNHIPLIGAISLVGQTDIRELARLISKADGVITCVSLPMHMAAAFNKPCVVVAGAREGTRWELYPNHQFLYVNGCLPCASYDGCWRGKVEDCNNKKENVPLCMHLIWPEDIVRAVERYYEGGMLEYTASGIKTEVVA